MTQITLKRQFITDAEGRPVAVILPIEEYALVREVLDQEASALDEAAKLAKMEQAAQDPLFLTDLRETMSAFAEADAEWWESPE
jgi:antitoxin (DNA-binding transcriptional repressor) of toxin-antitoxin stability system